jgi:hypothetical protein
MTHIFKFRVMLLIAAAASLVTYSSFRTPQTPMFTIRDLQATKGGTITWTAENEPAKTVYNVYESRWNKEYLLGKVKGKKGGTYTFGADASCGIYHIVVRAEGKNVKAEAKADVPDMPVITLKNESASDFINFSGTTRFEVYNRWGNIMTKGCDFRADISTLPTGVYYLNFGDGTSQINKL